jgi:Fic family protein
MQSQLRFDGPDYVPHLDDKRLTGQLLRVFTFMRSGGWRTLAEIEEKTGDPQASISAQLRHLRKERFGAHKVERRRRSQGTWEYRII